MNDDGRFDKEFTSGIFFNFSSLALVLPLTFPGVGQG